MRLFTDQKTNSILALILVLFLQSCTGKYNDLTSTGTTTTSSTTTSWGMDVPAARIVFHQDYFTDLDDFNPHVNASLATEYRCLGDVTQIHYADGDDFMGGLTPFPTRSTLDTLAPTYRPHFLKNVSVDITNTYFGSVEQDVMISDKCSHRGTLNTPFPSTCADFDRVPRDIASLTPATSTPTPSPTPTTNEFYDSKYYRVRDDWCSSQGPSVSPDPEVTKEGVGGVNIDLDRLKLGFKEDLLMVVTYHALNENSKATSWPAPNAVDSVPTDTPISAAVATDQTSNDRTILKVKLIGTSEGVDALIGVKQPRVWAYTNQATYPVYMKQIATLEDPFGSLRSEQVYIPLSQNLFADRIRIERVRGSFHLFQIDLYRLGNRSE